MPEPGRFLHDSAVVEAIRTSLAGYKVPRWFEFIPELPKTVTGKIQRFKLRSQ